MSERKSFKDTERYSEAYKSGLQTTVQAQILCVLLKLKKKEKDLLLRNSKHNMSPAGVVKISNPNNVVKIMKGKEKTCTHTGQ